MGAVLLFVVSLMLNMLVLERGGALLSYATIYGASGLFTLNRNLVLLSGSVGAFGLLSAFALHRTMLVEQKVRKHLAIVSMYMNGITLLVLLAIVVFPSVHLR